MPSAPALEGIVMVMSERTTAASEGVHVRVVPLIAMLPLLTVGRLLASMPFTVLPTISMPLTPVRVPAIVIVFLAYKRMDLSAAQ